MSTTCATRQTGLVDALGFNDPESMPVAELDNYNAQLERMTLSRTSGSPSVNTYLQAGGVSKQLVAIQSMKDCVIDINIYRYVYVKSYLKLQRSKYLNTMCANVNSILTIRKRKIYSLPRETNNNEIFPLFGRKPRYMFNLNWWQTTQMMRALFINSQKNLTIIFKTFYLNFTIDLFTNVPSIHS